MRYSAAALGLSATLLATAVPSVANAHEAGEILVRLRGIAVSPDESGSTRPFLGGKIAVNTTYAPEIDFSYFFTKNIAVELIAATTRHSMKLRNSALGNVDLGNTWVLPPTLTAQYHFFSDEIISPYIGFGVNYTVFYGETDGPTAQRVDVQNAWGYAFQFGADLQIPDGEGFVFNIDVKRIQLAPNIDIKLGGQHVSSHAFDLNPWVIGAGFGYKF